MFIQRFKQLSVWQKAIIFVSAIYKVTETFPREELFGLTSQLRRAAISIVLNIAEGSGSGSDPEFRRFLKIALRSVYEVIAALEIAQNLNLVEKDIIESLNKNADELAAMLTGLIKKL